MASTINSTTTTTQLHTTLLLLLLILLLLQAVVVDNTYLYEYTTTYLKSNQKPDFESVHELYF